MKINSILFGSVIMSVFVSGFIVGTCYYVPGIKFTNELNPLDALSIIVTIIIAVIVAMYFDVVKERRKAIQDITVTRINDINSLVNIFQEKVSRREIHYVEATSTLKRINTSLQLIFKVIGDKNITVNFTITEFQDVIKNINRLATDAFVVQCEIDPEIKIENNTVKYSAARAAEIETKVEVIKNKVFELQVALCSA